MAEDAREVLARAILRGEGLDENDIRLEGAREDADVLIAALAASGFVVRAAADVEKN